MPLVVERTHRVQVCEANSEGLCPSHDLPPSGAAPLWVARLYDRLLSLLSRPRQLLQVGEPAQRTALQHSQYRDWRHLKALAWMINALIYLICSHKRSMGLSSGCSAKGAVAARRLEGFAFAAG